MSLKSRAKVRGNSDMDEGEKLRVYDSIFKHLSSVLTTVPPFKEKKYANKVRAKVQYRETPEWIQEFETLYDLAPNNLYATRADFYRCLMRMAMYMATVIFEKCSEEDRLPDKIQAIEDTRQMQIMLQAIARDDMSHEVSERYEAIRRALIDRKPSNLAERLSQIDEMEKLHLLITTPEPTSDDEARGATLFSPASYYMPRVN